MAYLITGGCGFVGSNLSAHLIGRGEDVIVLDNLTRPGTPANLEWLTTLGKLTFIHADTRIASDIGTILRNRPIECIFHLAGQVAMTTSLADPRRDFEVNVVGTINLLEAVRMHAPEATVVFASSNKVYGGLEGCELRETATRYEPTGTKEIAEDARLEFLTPYGCSKGAADQYTLEYARSFGVRSVVFRHSTIYGGRQLSTFDQGWVGWFCQQALLSSVSASHTYTINGDGKQVRDLLHVSDAVRCYLAGHEHIEEARGQAFNIGGGYANSLSLLELFHLLEVRLGITLNYRSLPWRTNDQKYFVADNGKAGRLLGWQPEVSKEQGIEDSLAWEKQQSDSASSARSAAARRDADA